MLTRFPQFVFAVVAMAMLSGCKRDTKHTPEDWHQIPAAGYPETVNPSGSAEVDALVCQLVSQRPAPYRSGHSDTPMAAAFACYITPEVEAALQELKAMGPEIFPELVKHLGDDRYSYSYVVAAWLNFDVGDAVVEVLCDGHYMHSGYKGRETPNGWAPYLSFKDYLKARGAEIWAEWAKSKTRLEIQMDFIDWCLLQEDERGYVGDAQRKQVRASYERGRERARQQDSERAPPANNHLPAR